MGDKEMDEPGLRPMTIGVAGFLKLTGMVAALLFLFTSVYNFVLDSKLERLELRLQMTYAMKADALPRSEYELRHKELIEEETRMTKRIDRTENIADDNKHRIENLERSAKR
jgi:hypothetical protein